MTKPSARFLSQLGHDLRSPLNVIGSSLTELSHPEKLTPAERDQLIVLSQRVVSRLISLSDRLCLAGRLEGPIEVTFQPVDLVKLTRDTLERFLPGQLRRRIEVFTAWPEAPVMVGGDAGLLTTLLLELLTNANRYARREFRVEVIGGAAAAVNIDDDGEGVNDNERALLFEPFADRRSRTGLGMGLWLARRLAELHHGTLTLEPRTPGTRQRLTLPVER